MTFSILARDPKTGAIGGAAATGSYCVGGWVLRGSWGNGMSATQGACPSVYWGEETVELMKTGSNAAEAVQQVIEPDSGREWRQLAALDKQGRSACFTGQRNTSECAELIFENGVATGNMLANQAVVPSLVSGYANAKCSFEERIIQSLIASHEDGSDIRGLKSAALLIYYCDAPPLSLRIDSSPTPLEDLVKLFHVANNGEYASWLPNVPNPSAPYRVPNET